MVVLESGNMLPSVSNQYLQPDYLSSLPTTLDAKKSPLALLAQTCSQIGVDTVTTKPLHSTLEKSKKSPVTENVRSSPTKTNLDVLVVENKSPFKPYEKNMLVKKADKCATHQDYIQEKAKTRCSPDREVSSPTASLCATPSCESVKNSPEQTSATPSTRDTSPVIRPASEVLHEYSKETLLSGATSEVITNTSNAHITSCCSGSEQSNPAFRSSFPGPPFNFQHTSLFSTGYPNSSGPYSNYVRVKTPSGGEALVPVCKDIYCTGCQYNQHMLLNSPTTCPSGCSQCDHQKYNFGMMPFVPGSIPTSSAYSSLVKPYICNWISGDTYCGKRFVTSEELLQHLRSHTNGIESIPNSSSSSVLNPLSLFSSSSLHRPSYLNTINSINPLSSVRYHPYGKSTLQTLMGPSYSAFGPATFGSYYSPYSFYNQRFGAAAVHP